MKILIIVILLNILFSTFYLLLKYDILLYVGCEHTLAAKRLKYAMRTRKLSRVSPKLYAAS